MTTRRIAPTLAALALLAAAPAWAQSGQPTTGANSTPPSTTTPMTGGTSSSGNSTTGGAGTMGQPGRMGTGAGSIDSTSTSTSSKPWRASKLIGAEVYGNDNKKIGEIDDLLVGNSGGMQAVISVGGFLGIGDKLVSVPYSELQHGEHWMLPGADQDSLKNRPEFKYADNSNG
ncbi:PRC-barrel domain-containing protein [Roseomonas sp. E05]|uniref:PRC-barrel domain-containing protein n=1 Tax=Roseomonas sp. E05 TaxID=3046310 RepID=UPI0024BAC4E1|nr:PRC-barrel domain-containing protein [Roseomonas sp. E05]MDJ0388399.1 PRC-barrel domain-containing protein [Roseomonas sp. E05]